MAWKLRLQSTEGRVMTMQASVQIGEEVAEYDICQCRERDGDQQQIT